MTSPPEVPRSQSPNGGSPSSDPTQPPFDVYQCHALESVGKTMRIAGVATFAVGLLEIVATVLFAAIDNQSGLLLFATPSVLAFAAGAWTRRAGRSLQEIAVRPETQIPCLMSAAGDIQRVFRLQAILIFVGLALLIVFLAFAAATWHFTW
jgi:hypothetical protein